MRTCRNLVAKRAEFQVPLGTKNDYPVSSDEALDDSFTTAISTLVIQ